MMTFAMAYAVTTQPISLSVAPSAACMSFSATLTIDVSTISSIAPSAALIAMAHLKKLFFAGAAPGKGMVAAAMMILLSRVDGRVDAHARAQIHARRQVVQFDLHRNA